uniref:DUF2130 domain-containing protein n=1 Tax=Emticicia sp. TaxID=1930953 RepID=UPI003750FEDA
DIEKSISEKIKNDYRQIMTDWQKKEAERFEQKEQQRDAELKRKEQELAESIEKQRKTMADEIRERLIKESSASIESLNKQLENQTEMISGLRKKEIDFLEKERALKDEKDRMELEKKQFEMQIQDQIKEKLSKDFEIKYELIIKEKEKQLEDQKKLAAEMQRKAEQGSMQLQGEVQEMGLEEMLKNTFIYDEISEVGKGIRGADVIQTVKNELGQVCGKIIYESKRTQNFGGDWIEKLKDDQRQIGAEIAVLVTQTMPKEMERFGERDGVWICNYLEMKSLVFVLRKILIQTQTAKSANENKTDKMSLLYTYLTSNQFRQQIEAIVESFTTMKSDLDKERRAMQRIWKEREVQIEKVIGSTIDMYGSIRGIAGNAIAPIQYLELPGSEEE